MVTFKKNCEGCHSTNGQLKHVLSDDEVVLQVTDPNTTNTCRARTTMWERGKLWANFSSENYKQRIESGGRGYRNMPLSGIWSTSPFMHNQSIGTVAPANATPAARAAAFRTSMLELLQPARTPKVNRFPVTFGPIPAGTPVTAVFSRAPDGSLLCSDFVENRGHYFGSDLSADDKEELIYYLQYQ
jgi:hypothetical protein